MYASNSASSGGTRLVNIRLGVISLGNLIGLEYGTTADVLVTSLGEIMQSTLIAFGAITDAKIFSSCCSL